jgi:hypothetical protein
MNAPIRPTTAVWSVEGRSSEQGKVGQLPYLDFFANKLDALIEQFKLLYFKTDSM